MAQPDPRTTTQGHAGGPADRRPEDPGDGSSGRTDVAKQEGAEVADHAKQQARETAGTARQEADRVMSQAKHHVRDLADDARHQMHDQARQQTDHLGGAIGTMGDRLHALAEGRAEDAGPVGEYAGRLADQVDHMAGRVQELGFDGVVDELRDFARRRPGAFLAGALTAGFITARLARGAKDASDEENSSSTWRSEGTARATTSQQPATTTGGEIGQTGAPTLPPPSEPPLAAEDVSDRSDPLSPGRATGQQAGRINP